MYVHVTTETTEMPFIIYGALNYSIRVPKPYVISYKHNGPPRSVSVGDPKIVFLLSIMRCVSCSMCTRLVVWCDIPTAITVFFHGILFLPRETQRNRFWHIHELIFRLCGLSFLYHEPPFYYRNPFFIIYDVMTWNCLLYYHLLYRVPTKCVCCLCHMNCYPQHLSSSLMCPCLLPNLRGMTNGHKKI